VLGTFILMAAAASAFHQFNPSMLTAEQIGLMLPDGSMVVARAQARHADNVRGTRTWTGEIANDPGSLVTLAAYRGTVSGSIVSSRGLWDIYVVNGEMRIIPAERDPDPTEPVPFDDEFPTDEIDASGHVVVDLLVGYSTAVIAQHGENLIRSQITAAVAASNQVYANSGLDMSLRLVGLQEFPGYVEDGMQSHALAAVRATADGKIDYVHPLRDSLGADLVMFVVTDADSCGIAGVMTVVSPAAAVNGFSVMRPGCFGNMTMPHELGHNMGNKHDRANSSAPGAYPYSFGYQRCVSDGTGFRTVMAYPCGGAARKAYFSSPVLMFNGYPMGIDYETDAANSADNVRSMRNAVPTVAAFRVSVTKKPNPPTAHQVK
jgi:hypothetical protein